LDGQRAISDDNKDQPVLLNGRTCLRLFAVTLMAAGCRGSPKYVISDCVMPQGASSPEKIVRVVAVGARAYKTFSYFLSDGKLILGEDYIEHPRGELDRGYTKVECPSTTGTFSPERYLNEKGVEK
jgi:hypothetical protein